MPTVAATLKQINAIVDAFDSSIDQSDEMLIVGMTSRSLRNDLNRAYDVFNSNDFRQSSNSNALGIRDSGEELVTSDQPRSFA
jgi:hypothetical protein